ncbi:nucleoside transporter C-terminal domain-containing protein, partial [Acinetobacter baumannii]
RFNNWMDAISKGTTDGLHIAVNIAAMLIVVLALVALVNTLLGLLPVYQGSTITLQSILGLFMTPLTWLMGIPWSEALT